MSEQDVDDYLASAPEPQRTTLLRLRGMISALLPGAEQCISYGVPTFKVDGLGVAGFGHYAKHCAYFPMSGSITSALAEELTGYKTSKGSVHFAVDEPLPADVVRRLIEARRAEIAAARTAG